MSERRKSMSANGGRRTSREPKTGEAPPPWSHVPSVMHVSIASCRDVPFRPPTEHYLSEVLHGLRGGPGDRGEPSADLRERAALLLQLGDSAAARNACTTLLWLCLGLVFGSISDDKVTADFRVQLAESWYLLVLEMRKTNTLDREHMDWALDAWPYVFAQAIYRMLVDGFKEDKDNLIAQGAALLDKLQHITHFEVTGFRLDHDTGNKIRKKLFLRRVINQPDQDQFDFLQGADRLRTLERQKEAVGHTALAFSTSPEGGMGMDESQLHDVWENRRKGRHQVSERWGVGALRGANGMTGTTGRRSVTNLKAQRDAPSGPKASDDAGSGKKSAAGRLLEMQTAWLPSEALSADRYDDFTSSGELLMLRQIGEVAETLSGYMPEISEDSDEDESGDESPFAAGSPDDSPLSPCRAQRGTFKTSVPGQRSLRGQGSCEIATDSEAGNVSPSRRHWQTARSVGQVSALYAGRSNKDRREREKAARQKQLSFKIASAPLPKELQRKDLNTSWVSPSTASLCHDPDNKFLLKKRSAESFKLKMQSNRHSVSMPLLRARTPKDEGPKGRTASVAGTPGSAPGLISLRGGEPDAGASPRAASLLPRVSTATGARPQPQVPPGGELLCLTAPPSLSSKLTFQRMENTTKAFAKGSFAEYMKEYDIFTGEPRRIRIDWEEVLELEEEVVRASQDLVGGKAKKRTLHKDPW